MYAVPNHMLGQFSTELLTLYPGANILVAGKEDFESQNRKKLFSRIATGNWDAVIVTGIQIYLISAPVAIMGGGAAAAYWWPHTGP